MAINVLRESDTTKSRHVNPAYVDKDGNSFLASSEKPFPIADVNHIRLHEGRGFYVYHFHPDASLLADNANIDIAIAWASGKYPHLVLDVSCGGDAEFYVYENAVVTGGTSFTAINRYRSSANASASATLIDPTVSSVGTLLSAEFIPGGTGKKSSGGGAFSFQYVLSPLTTYLFRLTNKSNSAHMAHMRLEWYES